VTPTACDFELALDMPASLGTHLTIARDMPTGLRAMAHNGGRLGP
jgi:hypothetical protein